MAEQFTINKEERGTLYSCEKYSCFVRGTVLSDVTINEDIEELYVPEGVTKFAPYFESIKDCKVSRIILPSSLKELNCSSFSLSSLLSPHRIDINEIDIPSFSVIFTNTEELNWNQPFVVCKDSLFRLNISCLLDLKSQFPNAFSETGQGKCFFDNVWNDECFEYRSLDKDSVMSIGIWGRKELIVPEICKQGEDPKEKKIIACCFKCAPKRIYFPKTVQYVAFCYERGEKKQFELFDFAGKLPSFSEHNSGIDGAKLELLRINAPVAETDVPTLLKIMLEDAIDTGRNKYNGKVIFAAPALCEEDSSVPGFIRVTARLRDNYRLKDQISGKDKDIIISLNTRYIGSVEPFDIETYTPCVGSLVHIVTTGVEKHYTYVVYEPVETIMEKIRQTREHLDLESMIDRIREVLPKEIRE